MSQTIATQHAQLRYSIDTFTVGVVVRQEEFLLCRNSIEFEKQGCVGPYIWEHYPANTPGSLPKRLLFRTVDAAAVALAAMVMERGHR